MLTHQILTSCREKYHSLRDLLDKILIWEALGGDPRDPPFLMDFY